MEPGTIRVQIVAADGIARSGAEALLRTSAAIAVVPPGPGPVTAPLPGCGASPHAAAPPLVALLVADVLDEAAAALVRRVRPDGVPLVVVVSRVPAGAVRLVAELGVGALLWRRQATGEAVAAAVRSAARGTGALLPPELVRGLIDYVAVLHRGGDVADAGRRALSAREADVLRLLADGMDTAQAASALAYSDRTVKNILHELTTRLRLRNRTHAVAYALRQELI